MTTTKEAVLNDPDIKRMIRELEETNVLAAEEFKRLLTLNVKKTNPPPKDFKEALGRAIDLSEDIVKALDSKGGKNDEFSGKARRLVNGLGDVRKLCEKRPTEATRKKMGEILTECMYLTSDLDGQFVRKPEGMNAS